MADLWYYTCDGKQRDPVPEAELKRLAAEGVLRPSDMVWTEGMPRWVRASNVIERFAIQSDDNEPLMVIPVPAAPIEAQASEARTAAPARRRADEDDEPRPRRRPREREEEEEQPRRRRAVAERSTAAGVVMAGCVGGGILGCALLFAAGVLLYTRTQQHRPQQRQFQPVAPPMAVNWPPPKLAELPDVDIFIKDRDGNVLHMGPPNNKRLAQDTDDDPHCKLEWTFAQAGEYQVVIDNPMQQHPARPFCAAKASVSIREKARPNHEPIAFTVNVQFNKSETRKFKFNKATYLFTVTTEIGVDDPPEAKTPLVELPPEGVNPLNSKADFAGLTPGKEFICKVQVPARKTANISLQARGTGSNLQLSIQRERDGSAVETKANPGGPPFAVLPDSPRTEILRIRVVNQGEGPARGAVYFTEKR
jgi:hypothetical protein